MKSMVFWIVTPCSSDRVGRFGRTSVPSSESESKPVKKSIEAGEKILPPSSVGFLLAGHLEAIHKPKLDLYLQQMNIKFSEACGEGKTTFENTCTQCEYISSLISATERTVVKGEVVPMLN